MISQRLADFYDTYGREAAIELLQEKMEYWEVTAEELVLIYLERIARFNHDGPRINAVLEVNPDALHIARALDKERKQKGARGPLHGIPVLLKDNIDTGDNMHTSAGSLALAGSYAQKDAFVAAQVRKAGAVILGKTNMTEWANFMSDYMPNGYSSRGGQVLNPYGEFDAGGSSSGSGAAVTADFAPIAVGTETSGSILSPASQNALVGIKPTVGLISRSGIIPISYTQDTAGPMAKTVKDAAHLLAALMGADEADPATLANPLKPLDIAAGFRENGLSGAKIGVARDGFFDALNESQVSLMERAIEDLRKLGAEVADAFLPSARRNWSYDVMTYEFKAGLNAYLRGLAPEFKIRSLKDVIQFNYNHRDEALKFGQPVLLEAERTSGTLTESAYLKALLEDRLWAREKGIDAALQSAGLDALLFPSYFGCEIAAKAGYPSVTVPAGFAENGEPFGITFTAGAFSEPLLIRFAYAYEQATKHRKPPAISGKSRSK
ncbi:amidase family protein [Heyndrickxia coagulans]|uniref:Amidase domain-containing protein n=1 Tax=Heyndrickxia coagulans TaxID=1398 RepID=A0A150K3K4_HEYCO|nr:amidase family protein [Heyndrickxia coagulans]KYC63808.1 hypothetical protein B4098_2196 [Heyndrickxia coagulans]